MNAWFKALIAAGVVAVGIVVVQQQQVASEAEAWSLFAGTLTAVEALEEALPQVRGTGAEAWVAYSLAISLYETGKPEDRERAAQVAREALGGNPSHPFCSEQLRRLLAAVESFQAHG